jgi:shikimate 5-dehydrogenase
MKGRQGINFISSGEFSAPDQPSIWQWLSTPVKAKKFAAVLGDPIYHSYSPEMHREFFAKKQMPFFAIPIPQQEFLEAFEFLQELGLAAAAVTSPLKDKIGGNTWWKSDLETRTGNTDVLGLEEELQDFKNATKSTHSSQYQKSFS